MPLLYRSEYLERFFDRVNLETYTGIPYAGTVKVRVFATSRYEEEV